MKQKKYKSILSYLLIFAILITFIPVNTSAQEKKAQETEQPEKSKIADIHAAASGAALEALEAAQTVSPPAIGELGITQTPEITPIPTAEQTPEITPTADPEQTPAEAVPTSAPEFPEQTEKPAEDLYIYDSQTLEQDIICKHLFLMSGSLSLNGHSITVCGDMQQAGGTLYTDGGSISVQGDCNTASGTLSISGKGVLTVTGDMTVGGNSRIVMNDQKSSVVKTMGDLEIRTSEKLQLTNGTLEIGGNLIQSEEAARESIKTAAGFHILFNGKNRQNLSLSHPADTYLGTLDLRNSAGVEAPNELHGYNIIGMEKLHIENNLRLYMEWIKLQQDEILHNNTELYIQYCQLNGYALKVEGNLCIKEAQNIQINRGNLQVDGNLDCTIRDFLQVSNGTARIGGDLGIHSGCLQIYSTSEVTVCGSTNLTGTGSLAIEGENEKTNLSIGGNLAIATTKASNFTRGAIEIGGDINQQQETAGDSLQIKEKFHIILNGKTKQNLSLSHPADTYLGTLDLRNSAGLEAPNELHGYNIIGLDKLHTGETVRLYMENMQLQQDEVLNSNAEFHITYCALNEYTLNIGGNLTIDKGEIFSINKGKLKINGDFDCNMQNTFDIYIWKHSDQRKYKDSLRKLPDI